MLHQVNEKIKEGYKCIKIKVGAINFEEECEVIESIRNIFNQEEIEIRLDANGAFSESEVFFKLEYLSRFGIHSIEQPIKQGNWELMKEIVEKSPIPIALDEELIGVTSLEEKRLLLTTIRPNYIILKPSLHGGLVGTTEWIQCSKEIGIQWWITSALESNIGLSAICQFVSEFYLDLPQGLGTGSLYTNNINSDLVVSNGYIFSLK
jgi:L-alanine-DL-glutamate epimerase-like enolase superfamily enzyme